jgi:four helix bundle protein
MCGGYAVLVRTRSYKDLIVWQKSLILAEEIYALTWGFPKEELYCLVAQMRRAAISVPSNIAEGSRRKGLPQYLYFLRVAAGSAAELETQMLLAGRLYPMLTFKKSEELLVEIQKMLSGMIRKLRMGQ